MLTVAGQKLRAWRHARQPRLSGEAAADLLGISRMTLYRLEAGTRGCSDAIKRLIVAAGVCAFEDFHVAAVRQASPARDAAQNRAA